MVCRVGSVIPESRLSRVLAQLWPLWRASRGVGIVWLAWRLRLAEEPVQWPDAKKEPGLSRARKVARRGLFGLYEALATPRAASLSLAPLAVLAVPISTPMVSP